MQHFETLCEDESVSSKDKSKLKQTKTLLKRLEEGIDSSTACIA